ncbi:MAG: hypothetical protein SF182_12405 [Deltaproteobacteria bacterium]|nr:hypothetical protein [Deltaproteobacteria bacterium]
MRRRDFLRLAGMSSAGVLLANHRAFAIGRRSSRAGSLYGHWTRRAGVPVFVYSADQDALPEAEWDPILTPKTRRHWVMVGNQHLRLQAANDGTVAVFDEGDGLRWLTAADPIGTGVSLIVDQDGVEWGSAFAQRPGGTTPRRIFGPTSFEIHAQRDGLRLERLMLCPEGDAPFILVRVRLSLASDAPIRRVALIERWALRPRFCNLLEGVEQRRQRAALAVSYAVELGDRRVVARERFASPDAPGALGDAARAVVGPPAALLLQGLGDDVPGQASASDGAAHPTLEIRSAFGINPGERRELWFRFGRDDGGTLDDPAALLRASRRALLRRLPVAGAAPAPEARDELPWHAALLTGGLAVDRVLGGHTLDQASTYSYLVGFNGAARDPLQHALPLVYLDPDRALSVLRNTCAWATEDGDLPYALDARKQPTNLLFRPSDQNLWALWLAAEYAAATGDLAAFDAELAYHPARPATPVPLREHLRRQFRFFVDGVGRGEGGHVRILNADWNDVAIADSGVPAELMIERGGSVLNSAMAAWVLPVFAGLAERLGETALASEARAQGEELRQLVAAEWNGRWFNRASVPGGGRVGESDCWLENQPWALLCGAADADQAAAVLEVIERGHRADSPLGARLRWPARASQIADGTWGTGTAGGIWFSINMTLIWAAARLDPALAWDEWRRMTLAAHRRAYPAIWEGTLSGPDAWNAPEYARAGRTWSAPPLFAMQAFPVNNMHSHAQPLLAYLRLLGVEPTPRGTLAVGAGGRFRSPSFALRRDGHGQLTARGPVRVETVHGVVDLTPAAARW